MSEEAKSNLLRPHFVTTGDVLIDLVREAAEEACEKLLCIGIGKDGEPYYASSFGSDEEMLWMIEKFKARLLAGKFA